MSRSSNEIDCGDDESFIFMLYHLLQLLSLSIKKIILA